MTGAELQTLREACGLSRDELAELVGVQARTLKHWENGRAGVPADVATYVTRLDEAIDAQAQALCHADALQHRRSQPAGAVPGQWVLMRYREQAHALGATSGPRAQIKPMAAGGLPIGTGGVLAMRVRQLLRHVTGWQGVPVRVVWFNPAEFETWRSAQGLPDDAASRDAWAQQALPTQAIPHRADQPPG